MKSIQHKIIKKIGIVMTLSMTLGIGEYSFAAAIVQDVKPGGMGFGGWPNPRFEDAVKADSTRCADAKIDNLTGLMWQHNARNGGHTWHHLTNAATGAKTCGYTDWRLPDLGEMLSLVNYGSAGTPRDWLLGQGFFYDIPGDAYYWTSTANSQNSNQAWLVDIMNGSTRVHNKGSYEVATSPTTRYTFAWYVRGPKNPHLIL
ncbi:DUF1566 domain-containing protein [Fastidiosibacter lacustris]|uniref:Lcl C-terminal domain-containing protein n=1 Tax=Fastidiosibacter lacustris TaxID=2056695 RepID=UPI000E35093B|nr:DUF1566 domain-containing protein [Fastidiosibacter lacustris]